MEGLLHYIHFPCYTNNSTMHLFYTYLLASMKKSFSGIASRSWNAGSLPPLSPSAENQCGVHNQGCLQNDCWLAKQWELINALKKTSSISCVNSFGKLPGPLAKNSYTTLFPTRLKAKFMSNLYWFSSPNIFWVHPKLEAGVKLSAVISDKKLMSPDEIQNILY